MRRDVLRAKTLGLLLTLPLVAACGGAAAEDKPGGRATVSIDGMTYGVSDVKIAYTPGDGGSFRIEGDDARHADEDCLPGVSSGLALYGDLPSGVNSPVELSEKELPFEFTGDGDDHNLCFVGSKGLLGVEKGTVKFGRVYGGTIAFTFSGDFKRFDGEGGESQSTVHASGSGTATIE
jgi:hypothetical protein